MIVLSYFNMIILTKHVYPKLERKKNDKKIIIFLNNPNCYVTLGQAKGHPRLVSYFGN